MDDYRRLRTLADSGDNFLVIGGGFIGSEIVASLAHNDKRVTMVFPEGSIGSGMYPADLSAFLNDYYREHGVEVLSGHVVSNVETRGDRVDGHGYSNDSSDSREIVVDGVVAGLGIEPNVELARQAGLNG